ncbi:hypothetical protein GCM10029963_28590 [Micromonospora andamanensis]
MWQNITLNGRTYRVGVAANRIAAFAMEARERGNRSQEAALLDTFAGMVRCDRRNAWGIVRKMDQANLIHHPESLAKRFPQGAGSTSNTFGRSAT